LRGPDDTSIGAVPFVGGEMIPAGEAGDVVRLTNDDGGHDRRDAEHLGDSGLRCRQRVPRVVRSFGPSGRLPCPISLRRLDQGLGQIGEGLDLETSD